MKKWFKKQWCRRERTRRLQKDAAILGSQEWAEYLNGWYDDVTPFAASPEGGLKFKALGITLSKDKARLLLGRNKNYGYCLDLQAAGATFTDDGDIVGIQWSGIGVEIESGVDLFILWELICQHAYRYCLPTGSRIVFDIGMNSGLAALVMAARDPEAHIYGYEPFPDTFKRLRRNLALNPRLADRIESNCYALADRQAREVWCMGVDNPGTSSQFNDALIGQGETVEVDIRAASAAMEKALSRHANAICVVKMDCEGGEYAVMHDWAATGFAHKIDLILMEYHEVGGHRLSELEAWFKANGFAAVVLPTPDLANSARIGLIHAHRLPVVSKR